MTIEECRHESAILEALATGVWTPASEAHLEDCPDCAELVEIDRALQSDARIASGYEGLPDGDLIWRRFELESVHLRAKEATLPIRLLEQLTFGLALLVAVYGLITLGPSIGGWLSSTGSSLTASFGGIAGLGPSALVLLGVTGLVGIFVQGLRAHWSEI